VISIVSWEKIASLFLVENNNPEKSHPVVKKIAGRFSMLTIIRHFIKKA
jgi:hypothetical protein